MEVSYCTFGFDTKSWRDLRILLLMRDSPGDNFFKSTWERQIRLNENCLAGLTTKKSGGTITHLHISICDGKMAATTDFPFKCPCLEHRFIALMS